MGVEKKRFKYSLPLIGVVTRGPFFADNNGKLLSASRKIHPGRLDHIRLNGDGDGLRVFGREESGQLRTWTVAPWRTLTFRGRHYACLPILELLGGGGSGQPTGNDRDGRAAAVKAPPKGDLCLVEIASRLRPQLSTVAKQIRSAVVAETEEGDERSSSVLNRLGQLPWELVMNVLKHLDYDQVRWLLRSTPYFEKHFLSAHPQPEYRAGDFELSYYLANRLVLREGEQMWMGEMGSPESVSTGYDALTPLAMKPGTYTCERARSVTAYKFVEQPSCTRCAALSVELRRQAFETQSNMEFDYSRHMYLVRLPEEGEEEPTLADATTNVPLVLYSASGCDYLLHMWKRGDQDWPRSSYVDGGTKFLITKDPIRLMSGERKKLFFQIDHATAIVEMDSRETLGYMIPRRFSAVYPKTETAAGCIERKTIFTGLHFLPTCVSQEIKAAIALVDHRKTHIAFGQPQTDIHQPPCESSDFINDHWPWLSTAMRDGLDYHKHSLMADVTVCTKIRRACTPSTDFKEAAAYHHLLDPDEMVCPDMTIGNAYPDMLSAIFSSARGRHHRRVSSLRN